MCRIFCSPDKEQTFVKRDLWKFFEVLERALGRDGNGVYNLTTKELWKSHKKMPKHANIRGGLLFHTRLATNGYKKDYNCQPFDNEKYVFVHNGVFSGIESYARLLGFRQSSKKYSDSYMMAWVMEKVGVLDFYNAFRDKSYGVIVVYDKKVDRIYLLKTSGNFEYGRLETGLYIYGSDKLEYWRLKEKPESLNNGLYIISEDGFTQLDKIEYTSRYVQYYSNAHAYTYDRETSSYTKTKKETMTEKIEKRRKEKRDDQIKSKLGDKFCAYCSDVLEKEHTYDHCGNKICELCNTMYEEKDGEGEDLPEEEPMGIGALFAQIMPTECYRCKWIYERKCWFGGVEHDKSVNVTNPDTKKILCNTETSNLDLMVNCESCNRRLSKDDAWGIFNGLITCEKCREYEEAWGRSCDTCQHYDKPSGDEPCSSCWGADGNPKNWKIKKVNSCEGCYYGTVANTDYPCKICKETVDGMSEWLAKGETPYTNRRCSICGAYFETWDTPMKDEKGNLVCYDCNKYGYLDEEREAHRIHEDNVYAYENDRNSEEWDEWDQYEVKRGR